MARYYVRSFITIVVMLAIIGGIFWLGSKYGTNVSWFGSSSSSSNWQAVTLDNGIIYFGRLSHKNDQYVVLDNVYVAQQNPDAKTDDKSKTPDPNTPQYLLQKISNAVVFGPEKSMEINRDHVLFIQNLAPDSQVIKTIESDTAK